jgi:MoaA/NifB/PqqE/SkfB family radical SAM enzyme
MTEKEIKSRMALRVSKPIVYRKVLDYGKKLEKGESIAIIQLQYDYRCNFHCQHCAVMGFKRNNGHRELDVDMVRNVFDQAHEMGLAQVGISGGEPLLFKDLDEVINAIGPERFHIQVDTNGLLMTNAKARHLKEMGVDKIQVSIDSLNKGDHDSFRNHSGAYEAAMKAIKSVQDAGLSIQVSTVVTPQRARSEEFESFLGMMKEKNAPVAIIWPKPVGEWEDRLDLLISEDDINYVNSLKSKYDFYDHLTPGYGLNIGCLAVKRYISITRYGDIMPCIWMYFSLGNVFDAPLKDIVQKGLRYFGKREEKCLVSQDRKFVETYISKTYGKRLPVPIEEIMGVRCQEQLPKFSETPITLPPEPTREVRA